MESELEVSDSLSTNDIKEGVNDTLLLSYFDELFPTYLLYGMTYEQYWEQDCELAVFYRKKHDLEITEYNQKIWLQGAYIYNVLCSVAPLYNSLKPQEPKPYIKEPFPLNEQEKQVQEERENSEKIKEYMMSFMTKFNKEKEG